MTDLPRGLGMAVGGAGKAAACSTLLAANIDTPSSRAASLLGMGRLCRRLESALALPIVAGAAEPAPRAPGVWFLTPMAASSAAISGVDSASELTAPPWIVLWPKVVSRDTDCVKAGADCALASWAGDKANSATGPS